MEGLEIVTFYNWLLKAIRVALYWFYRVLTSAKATRIDTYK